MYKIITVLGLLISVYVQAQEGKPTFRNGQLDVVMTPFKMPMPDPSSVVYIDLDKDGDPDVLKATLPNGIHVLWVDDDDDKPSKPAAQSTSPTPARC